MYHLIDYVWCVEKFAAYFDAHKQEVYPLLTSPIFAYKNTRWVLNLYPEGLGDAASHGYISLFIKYVSEDPENINAKVELSLLNNKNERVYGRDTGDHQYQTFIDFGYKQFLKISDINEQKEDLILNGVLKIFARVEFEHATLPTSLTWSNYDLLLFKENLKDLYETKNLCDIVIRVVCKSSSSSCSFNDGYCSHSSSSNNMTTQLVSIEGEDSLLSSNPPQHHLDLLNHHHHHHQDLNSAITTNKEEEETLEIKSHKFILASRSGKFRELLKTNIIKLNTNINGEIAAAAAASTSTGASDSSSSSSLSLSLSSSSSICDLLIIETDRSPKVIEYLIRYMYTGYLDTLDSYAKDIYDISKEYKVHGLTNLAREHIVRELHVLNCCDLLVFCVVNNDYELNNKIQAFMSDNYECIVKTSAYKQAKRKYRELFENTFSQISKSKF